MAVYQNPVLTDGWGHLDKNSWGRGLAVLTDGYWLPECLPLDKVYFNLGVSTTPQLRLSIMDQLKLNLGVVTSTDLKTEICREQELSLSIEKEKELDLSITKEIEIKVEG